MSRFFTSTFIASPPRSVWSDGTSAELLAGDAEADDPIGIDPHDGIVEPFVQRLATRRHGLRASADLDHPRLPRRLYVVDHDARAPGALHVAVLLRLAHPQPADVDRVVLGVVPERRRHDVWLAVAAHRRDAAEALRRHVVDLFSAEDAHAAWNHY